MGDFISERSRAEQQLSADVDRLNELEQPLMANAAAHKRRDAMVMEARNNVIRSARLFAFHIRRAKRMEVDND
jgi:hypothetical protein